MIRRAGPTIALLACAGLLACGGEDPPAPATRPADVVLEFDGLTITRGEIEAFFPYLEALDPTLGLNYRRRVILAKHLIPLKLAQRAFAEPRAGLKARAEALVRNVGNGGYPDLVAKSRHMGGYQAKDPLSRNELAFAATPFAFDREHLGQVRGPIEVPQGFVVLATAHVTDALTKVMEKAEVWQVPFFHHDGAAFGKWVAEALRAAGRKVTYVHPEYRDVLPKEFQT